MLHALLGVCLDSGESVLHGKGRSVSVNLTGNQILVYTNAFVVQIRDAGGSKTKT